MKQSGFEIESLNTRMTKSPMPLLMLALIGKKLRTHMSLVTPALSTTGEERGREGASRRGEQKSMRHRVETRRGSFVRRFRLPENAKLEKINSGLDHGVLTLTKTNVQETPRNVRHIDVA
ncbi:hypothetical protein WN944_008435 [Citrus x changshan-huyou]|uniref:SHSP domain-containing protein n=1 Tax=Citrus x changshan-huyou TaxID=2935761 RepID=A0AAP0MSJ4_9ROSI